MMHPGYPEVVKIALASDMYWGVSAGGEVLQSGASRALSLLDSETYDSIKRDERAIWGTATTIYQSGEAVTVEPVPWGERIPEVGPQQAVVAIEDSRLVVPTFSLYNMTSKIKEAKRSLAVRARAQHPASSFEEDLMNVHGENLSVYAGARTNVRYNWFRTAFIRRARLYLRKDEGAGAWIAQDTLSAMDWESRESIIKIIPDEPLGAVYSKGRTRAAAHIGRIIEAHVVTTASESEIYEFENRPPGSAGKPKGKPEKERLGKRLPRPRPAYGS
ncbi:MAG TPA: hypothetical protein VHB72_00970 [Candidatus Saccharimonadales bacterium]|nr:hypothetical protein [Candidatus Saccharimonadales bacterium]